MIEILQEFQSKLISNGSPNRIIWLPCSSMLLTSDTLYIRDREPRIETDYLIGTIANALSISDDELTLILVARGAHFSYCSLLLDTFGTDDAELASAHTKIHLWYHPYVTKHELVSSSIAWWRKKVLSKWQISSLDYAFE
jgi:hypothetical protein